MEKYDHGSIEKKWQKRWEETAPNRVFEDASKEKSYLMIEFPYPSGDGLHVGHVRSWTALDVVARKRRAEGKNVLYPIGWDAFGLPTENYAIKTGRNPKDVTRDNTDNFRRQIKSVGLSFDWSREVNTTDPAYYKWTQWIFLKMYEKGLAYKAKTLINWCPKDKIGLANEEVIDGCCERCGTPVEKREKEQWMLAITKYAQRLYDDLDTVDYIERAKVQQKNWIGPSEGAEIDFDTTAGEKIKIFTTRPDTLLGATYMVLAPEHAQLQTLLAKAENKDEVLTYAQAAKNKSEIERTTEGKEKTGIEIKGVRAVNPINKEEIPMFVADYVLGGYGTGAIMAVPAHDERDFAFAKKFNLPIRQVLEPVLIQTTGSSAFKTGEPFVDHRGVIVLIKHWSEEKYLALGWKSAPDWGTLLTGSIDEGMNPEDTVLKEIQEETGFKNAKIIKPLGTIHGKYFHVPKNANRMGHAPAFYVELADGERSDIAEEESAKHELRWLSLSELKNFLTPLSHQTAVSIFEKGIYTGTGILINSGAFNGLSSDEAKKKIAEAAGGRIVTTFKLRDWVFSRQRYWGEPIPMINCPKDGWVPVPVEQLPVTLPEVEKYLPTDTGESPLSTMHEWVNTMCPACGSPAKRETDVMPNWAGSSWYWLRYTDPNNDKEFASKEKLQYWTPVNWYNGGMEHTVLHLLYSRFWHKFLFDQGLVPTSEPYMKRTSHGLILAEDGSKMSKSKGNTVSPDEIVKTFGADSLRLYEMFIGPFDQPVSWSTNSILGVRRFLERTQKFSGEVSATTGFATNSSEELTILLNQTIKKIGEDIENLKMNTAVSSLMVLLNKFEEYKKVSKDELGIFLKLLAPFAPHLASELAEQHAIDLSTWPTFDPAKLAASTTTLSVQVNGKMRGTITIAREASKEEAITAAYATVGVAKWLPPAPLQQGEGGVKVIYVPGKILSFVGG